MFKPFNNDLNSYIVFSIYIYIYFVLYFQYIWMRVIQNYYNDWAVCAPRMKLVGWTSLGLTTYLWSGLRISYFGSFTEIQLNCLSLWIVLLSLSYYYTDLTLSLSLYSQISCTLFNNPSSSLASLIYSLIISGELWLLL